MSFRDIYDRQIASLQNGDLEMLLAQYADDAELIRFDRTIQGKGALREFFTGYMQQIAPFTLVSTDHYTETDDAIFFEATVQAAGHTVRVYDVFIIEDEKIRRHFAGVIS